MVSFRLGWGILKHRFTIIPEEDATRCPGQMNLVYSISQVYDRGAWCVVEREQLFDLDIFIIQILWIKIQCSDTWGI
jgi:hypothetical protein